MYNIAAGSASFSQDGCRGILKARKPQLGLVVPLLSAGGGVRAVAKFVKDVALSSGYFQLRLISLSMSSRDSDNLRFSSPQTWFRAPKISGGVWEGLPFVHVGAVGGEFEFQRYRPRAALNRVLSDCDILQVVAGSPAWANVARGLGKPVALLSATRARVERRMRDGQSNGALGWWRKSMTAITDRLDDRALREVDAIQVINPWMLEYATTINAGRKVDLRYAPPGIDVESFHPLSQRSLIADPYILCVARLSDPRKNIGLLLEAYAQLPSALIDRVRLVLAGSSGPPTSFWQRVSELGLQQRVSYIARPERDALISLYQNASVFALPSDEEGLGVVLLEAMACAVPVVVTRCGGPDGIITDGTDGYLVALDDAQGMSARLRQLLENHAMNRAMGLKARITVTRKYSEAITGAVFLDIWNGLLNKK